MATVDGKPESITVRVLPSKGPEIAAVLQADLMKRQASNVRPWFDFEHKRGVASALPKAFRYEAGKGVMCALEWTAAGKAAIEGRDYSYFSPEFYIGDDGVPNGLPERGPLGALVNEPAFREIPRIAAGDASTIETNHQSTMSKLIFAALAISAAAVDAESEAVKAIDKLKSDAVTAKDAKTAAERERDEWKRKAEAADTEIKKVRKDRADSLVKAAVADGRIAAKDTEKQDKFREKIAAGDTFAEEMLGMLPKQNTGLDKTVIQAGAQAPAAGNVTPFETKAQALVTAGQAKTIDEAFCLVAASDPTAYGEYLKTLKKD